MGGPRSQVQGRGPPGPFTPPSRPRRPRPSPAPRQPTRPWLPRRLGREPRTPRPEDAGAAGRRVYPFDSRSLSLLKKTGSRVMLERQFTQGSPGASPASPRVDPSPGVPPAPAALGPLLPAPPAASPRFDAAHLGRAGAGETGTTHPAPASVSRLGRADTPETGCDPSLRERNWNLERGARFRRRRRESLLLPLEIHELRAQCQRKRERGCWAGSTAPYLPLAPNPQHLG